MNKVWTIAKTAIAITLFGFALWAAWNGNYAEACWDFLLANSIAEDDK